MTKAIVRRQAAGVAKRGFSMRNRFRAFSVVALAAAIGFSVAAVPASAQYNPESEFEVTRTADLSGVIILSYTGTATEVNIPPHIRGLPVVGIGENAFRRQQGNRWVGIGLTSVTIPESVTSIGNDAFWDNRLTSVAIPNGVTDIGSWAFENNQLTGVVIPDSVTVIRAGTFRNNQLTSVAIPNGVIRIAGSSSSSTAFGAFYGNQLTSVVIPDSIRHIGGHAFANNPLTSVTIGANVNVGRGNPFQSVYQQSNRRAGIYVFRNGAWAEEW